MDQLIRFPFNEAYEFQKRRGIQSLLHGPPHWLQVFDNCLRLDPKCDTKTKLHYAMFAAFHDVARLSDYNDPDHGKRVHQYFELPIRVMNAIHGNSKY